MDLDTIVGDFEALEPGEERYRYLIDLGRELPGLPDDLKIEAHRVHGCQSQVWMVARREGDRVVVEADSDAFIVRGLVAILLAIFSGHTASEIAATDPTTTFARMGLEQHLSLGRRNGLHAMVGRIKALAASA